MKRISIILLFATLTLALNARSKQAIEINPVELTCEDMVILPS